MVRHEVNDRRLGVSPPESDYVVVANPAGLPVFEFQSNPAERKRAVLKRHAASGKSGGFLSGVGFSRNGAQQSGAPRDDCAAIGADTICVKADH